MFPRSFERIASIQISLCLLLLASPFTSEAATERVGIGKDEAIWASVDDLNSLDRRIESLEMIVESSPAVTISRLPPGLQGHWMDPLLLKEGHDACWIQVDLGKKVSPELIAVIPRFGDDRKPNGFSPNFQVTLSDDPTGTIATIISDYSQSPFLYEQFPFLLIDNSAEVSGRYLRITPSHNGSTNARQWNVPHEPFNCAMTEIYVLSGEENLALGAPVTSSVAEVPDGPQRLDALTDGLSPLGPPEYFDNPSALEGYHSLHNEGKTIPDEPYWAQIDLGEEKVIDQVNLIPVYPCTFPEPPGYGFPVRFKIEISRSRDFKDATEVFNAISTDFRATGNHLIAFPGNGEPGRWVRITVNELFRAGWNSRFFALAEMQVISEKKNVSVGQPVETFQSLDQLYYPALEKELANSASAIEGEDWNLLSERQKKNAVRELYNERLMEGRWVWGEQALTDGYSSQQKLMPLPEWLRKVSRRSEAEFELGRLLSIRADLLKKEARAAQVALRGGILLGVLLFAVSLWLVVSYSFAKRKALRTRIAQDLHDDLSSEICNISLIAQQLKSGEGLINGGDSRRLDALIDSSSYVIVSLRDLLFFTKRENQTWEEVIHHLRTISKHFLEPLGIEYRFLHDDSEKVRPTRKAPPRVLRNVILIFKEALSNVCKHSNASRVEISVSLASSELRLDIIDDGCGIPTTVDASKSFGLWSMQARAGEIQGKVRLRNAEETGTWVSLELSI